MAAETADFMRSSQGGGDSIVYQEHDQSQIEEKKDEIVLVKKRPSQMKSPIGRKSPSCRRSPNGSTLGLKDAKAAYSFSRQQFSGRSRQVKQNQYPQHPKIP